MSAAAPPAAVPPASASPRPSPPLITRGALAHTSVLISAKVATNAAICQRPPTPAWAPLPCGRVASACVADGGDVVVLDAELKRLGRLPLAAALGSAVQCLAGARGRGGGAGGGGSWVVAGGSGGDALVVDVGEGMLVPMRKKMNEADGAAARREARIVARLGAVHAARGCRVSHVAVAECAGGLVVFGSIADSQVARVVAWVVPDGLEGLDGEEGVDLEGCVVFVGQDASQVTCLSGGVRDGGREARAVVGLDDSDGGLNIIVVDVAVEDVVTAVHSFAQTSVMPERMTAAETGGWQEYWYRVRRDTQWLAGVRHVVRWGTSARCDFGRVLSAVDGGGQRVVFGGEDDCVYGSWLERQQYQDVMERREAAPHPAPMESGRERYGQHQSFVSGVAVRDGMVASAGWDGKVYISPMIEPDGTVADGCRVDGPVLVADLPAGKTFWRVEWPRPDVLLVATVEGTNKRSTLWHVDLCSGEDDPEDSGSVATAASPRGEVPELADAATVSSAAREA